MQKIETEQYIMYELGFLDGKDDTLLKIMELENNEEVEEYFYDEEEYTEHEWYQYGYEIATKYYFSEYEKGKKILVSSLETLKKLDETFVDKVIQYNQKSEIKIPMAVYKVKRIEML